MGLLDSPKSFFCLSIFVGIALHRYYIILGFTHDKESMVNKHFDDYKCENLIIGNGGEDIATTSDGLAFITSGLGPYPPYCKKKAEQAIYVTDLNVTPVRLTEVTIISEIDLQLNPHGLDLVEDGDRIFLFVVNHHLDLSHDAIEKFEYIIESNELVWLKSYSDSAAIRSVNDVVAISVDEFYCTNDFHMTHQTPFLRFVENYSTIRLGSVAHCNGAQCALKTSSNIGMANGIITRVVTDPIDKTPKTELLVAYCYSGGVGVYDILPDGDLVYNRTIPIPPLMDNFWGAPDGSIYLSGSAHGWRFLWSMVFPNDKKPLGSEVVRILPNSDKWEQVYFDDGLEFPMSSIAVFWGENILMGSPSNNLMACSKKT